jgi:hypothetical protein
LEGDFFEHFTLYCGHTLYDREKAMHNWRSIGMKREEYTFFGFKELIYSSDRVEK